MSRLKKNFWLLFLPLKKSITTFDDIKDTQSENRYPEDVIPFYSIWLADIIVSDNGPKFSYQEFLQITNDFDFGHPMV